MSAKRSLRLAAMVVAFTAAVSLAAAQGSDTYSLRRMFKQGQSDTYRFDVTIEGAGAQPGTKNRMQVNLVTTETVKEVRKDGGVLLETRLDSGTATIGDSKMPLPMNGQVISTTLDASGKVVKQEGGGPFAGLANMAAMGNAMPAQGDRRFRAGEEIKFDTATGQDGSRRMKGTATVVGLEKASDDVPVPTVKVHTVADGVVPGAQGDQKLHIDVNSYFEPDTGKVLKLTGTVTGVNVGMMQNATVTLKRVRVPALGATPPVPK